MNRADLLEQSILKIKEYARYGSKPGLERVRELLRRLGDPHRDLSVIHVGGTNGKGSVCRYVYSVLQRSGFRCGLFISPFIEEFTEIEGEDEETMELSFGFTKLTMTMTMTGYNNVDDIVIPEEAKNAESI